MNRVKKNIILLFTISFCSVIVTINAQEIETQPRLVLNYPKYEPPLRDMDIRRREGGLVSGNDVSGISRGANRGVSRGVSRGVNRGVARGANRGIELSQIKYSMPPEILAPIASEHTGLTQSNQPSLYWYLSAKWDGPVHFTLNEPRKADPIAELVLLPEKTSSITPFFKAGMHRIDLAKHKIKLKENVEYEWFVYLVLDPIERSSDFLASATIMHKRPSLKDRQQLDSIDQDKKYMLYAQQGYWYDAILSLSQLLTKTSEDKAMSKLLHTHLYRLIEQVNMPFVKQKMDDGNS